MKRVVIVLALLLVISMVSADNVDIKDMFKIPPYQQTFDLKGNVVHFYAGDKLIASKDNNELQFHYRDRMGSDTSGKQLPFGQELIDSGERFEFTGKELDSDSDLHYFNARYYDSRIGKFLSVDPVKENHAYAYVMNNPMNFVDPTGMDELSLRGTWEWMMQKSKYAIGGAANEALEKIVNAGSLEDKREMFRSLPAYVQTQIREQAYKYASKGCQGTLRDNTNTGVSGTYTGALTPRFSKGKVPNILRIYLGLEPNPLPMAKYSPTSLTKYQDVQFYSIAEYTKVAPLSSRGEIQPGEVGYHWSTDLLESMLKMSPNNPKDIIPNAYVGTQFAIDLARYTSSIGRDDNGFYLSIFDVWNFDGSYSSFWSGGSQYEWQGTAMSIVGNPLGVYDRHYFSEADIRNELDRRNREG